MKNKVCSCLRLLIILPILLGILVPSISAASLENGTWKADERIYINPLYADVMTEEDLVQPGIMSRAAVTYYESTEEAGVALRDAMETRQRTIKIGLKKTENLNDMYDEIIEVALAHTGEPTEGDYLRRTYGGYRASAQYNYGNGVVTNILITYTVTYYTTAEQEAEMDAAVTDLLNQLDLSGKSDYEKIEGIYDYICDNIVYDYANLENDAYKLKYSAYAALVNKTAVCQGYANLFYRLALELGVDNRMISGYSTQSGRGHAWNIVKLNDLYYNVDATWDAGNEIYSYFLRCEENFLYHARDDKYKTPAFHATYPMSEEDFPQVASFLMHPQSVTLEPGMYATFYVAARGAVAYQWQSKNVGGEWENIDSCTSDTIIVEVAAEHSGNQYRCVITDVLGNTVVSEAATLTVDGAATTVVSGTCGTGVNWTLSSDGVLTVSGSGAMADFKRNNAPWYANRDLVKTVVVEPGVTTIGISSFKGCVSLVSVTMPDGVTSIGENAFYNCFKLASVAIPKDVTTIGRSAFVNCKSLTSVTIPKKVSFIGDWAFAYCAALTSFDVDPDNTAYTAVGGVLFSKDMTTLRYYPAKKSGTTYSVPKSVTAIGEAAFYEFESLTSVTIPESVTIIEARAFAYCTSLASVTFLGDAPEVDSNAFPENAILYYSAGTKGWTTPEWNGWTAYPMEQTEVKNGLHMDENGVWKNYVNGKVDTDYTGLVQYDGVWYYVAGGVLDWGYTGPTEFGGTNYFVTGGMLVWDLYGLYMDNNGTWYNLYNSMVNVGYTGLVEHYGTWYYVADGVLDFGYTGSAEFGETNYFVAGGVLVWGYEGLYMGGNGAWYYLYNSVVNTGYTGLVLHTDGNWYYVAAGAIDWTYTGVVNYGGTLYYVANGCLDWSYTGNVHTPNGFMYHVVDGVVVRKWDLSPVYEPTA